MGVGRKVLLSLFTAYTSVCGYGVSECLVCFEFYDGVEWTGTTVSEMNDPPSKRGTSKLFIFILLSNSQLSDLHAEALPGTQTGGWDSPPPCTMWPLTDPCGDIEKCSRTPHKVSTTTEQCSKPHKVSTAIEPNRGVDTCWS